MKLLAGTVIADHQDSKRWYDLQQSQLMATTGPTSHVESVCVCNMIRDTRSYQNVLESILEPATGSQQHARGLNKLLDHFRQERKRYDYFLILDSDAFPYRDNWLQRLDRELRKYNFDCAAVIRFENLANYIWPGCMLFNQSGLDAPWIDFDYTDTATDMLNSPQRDAGASMIYQNQVYPLIRTNRINPHPVFLGCYGHCFYHHGAGSRSAAWRGERLYYDQYKHSGERIKRWQQALWANPQKFIAALA